MEDNILQALHSLNPAQKEAVLHEEGPLVVFAGAGSGKTRVITTRIALYLAKGVRPSSILAVTFTNKAAREMKERIETLSPFGKHIHVGTFHSLCARWLREFASELGFTSQFSIYDDADSINAIKALLKESNLDTNKVTPQQYKQAISWAKNKGWVPSELVYHEHLVNKVFPPMGQQVYARYQDQLASSNSMDFDDLLLNMLTVLKKNRSIRELLQRRYQHILVDEYQDTNPTQFALIAHLTHEKTKLVVVGDDDQSIYSWRGADPSNILNFGRLFPGSKEVRLEQNYRCAGNIVKAASSLIQNNKLRAAKTLWTEKSPGEGIEFVWDHDGELEAWNIVDSVNNEKKLYAFDEVAILYRTNAQSRQLEDALRKKGIPYRILGALKFYDRAEIKDIIGYFRILTNPDDSVAFRRIVNLPTRGIGKKSLEDLEFYAAEQRLPLWKAATHLQENGDKKKLGKISNFLDLISKLKGIISQHSLGSVLPKLLEEIGYIQFLQKKFPEQASDKIANVHELASALADYDEVTPNANLGDWLKEVSLTSSSEDDGDENGVTLMTLHSAKGLEFNRVYIAGLEEGLLPHSNSMDNPDALEEERRLLYVGITRTKSKLTLTCASRRRLFDRWTSNPPSRFLREIPVETFAQDPSFAIIPKEHRPYYY